MHCLSSINRAYRRQKKRLAWNERIELVLGLLVGCAVLFECSARYLGHNSSLFLRLILEGTPAELYSRLLRLTLSVTLSGTLVSVRKYLVSSLARLIRLVWTEEQLSAYFGLQKLAAVTKTADPETMPPFYRLQRDQQQPSSPDNPDQRLTHDAKQLCWMLAQIVDRFMLSPSLVLFYSRDVYLRNGPRALLIIYTFFLLGTVLQVWVVSQLAQHKKRLDRHEGDYRRNHTEACHGAELIVLADKSTSFAAATRRTFVKVDRRMRVVLQWQLFADLVGNSIAYLGGVLNYFVLYWTLDFQRRGSPGEMIQHVTQVG